MEYQRASNLWGMRDHIESISHKLFLYVQSNEEMRDNGYGFVEVWFGFRHAIIDEISDLKSIDWLDLADVLPKCELDNSAESIVHLTESDNENGFFEHCYTLNHCKEYNAKAWLCDQIWDRTIDLADKHYAEINQKQTRI